MTFNRAHNFFERLVSETSKKSEIKIYKKFLHILTKLESREFSTDEIQAIETELEDLDIKSNPGNRKRYFKKALSRFENYLKETFSLTTKGYYSNSYGGLGLIFGMLFGVIFLASFERSLGISLGLIGGMVIGSLIGHSMDAKAIAEGRVL